MPLRSKIFSLIITQVFYFSSPNHNPLVELRVYKGL